jgi:ZIP family zinc transporter
MALITLIDFLVPESGNPHEIHGVEEMNQKDPLHRVGFVVALSIAIHNFPEGIAVSVPIYHATGSKKKAFGYSFLSGLAEPMGALIAYLFLMPFWTSSIDGFVLAAVSGIMVFISLDELLPSAEKYGEHHISIAGLVTGMAIMGFSLFLFA